MKERVLCRDQQLISISNQQLSNPNNKGPINYLSAHVSFFKGMGQTNDGYIIINKQSPDCYSWFDLELKQKCEGQGHYIFESIISINNDEVIMVKEDVERLAWIDDGTQYQVKFKSKKQFQRCAEIIFTILSGNGATLKVEDKVFSPEVDNIDFLIETIKINPQGLLVAFYEMPLFVQTFMSTIDHFKNDKNAFQNYNKCIRLFQFLMKNLKFEKTDILFNKNTIDHILMIYSRQGVNLIDKFQKQKCINKDIYICLDEQLKEQLDFIKKMEFLQKYILSENLMGNEKKINYSKIPQRQIQNIQFLSLLKFKNFIQLKKSLFMNQYCNNETLIFKLNEIQVKKQRQIKKKQIIIDEEYEKPEQIQIKEYSQKIASSVAQLILLGTTVSNPMYAPSKQTYYNRLLSVTSTKLYQNNLKLNNGEETYVYCILQAYSKALPLDLLIHLENNWQQSKQDFRPDTKILGALVQHYNNGKKQAFDVLYSILRNASLHKTEIQFSPDDQIWDNLHIRYFKVKGLVTETFPVLFSMCQSIQAKLELIRIFYHVFEEIKQKIFKNNKSQQGVYLIIFKATYSPVFFYQQIVQHFRSSKIHKKNDIMNLAILLKINLEIICNEKYKIVIQQQQQNKQYVQKRIIQSGFISVCIEQILQVIHKNNIISSMFLAALRVLESSKKNTLYHEYLLNIKDFIEPLHKYIPSTLQIPQKAKEQVINEISKQEPMKVQKKKTQQKIIVEQKNETSKKLQMSSQQQMQVSIKKVMQKEYQNYKVDPFKLVSSKKLQKGLDSMRRKRNADSIIGEFEKLRKKIKRVSYILSEDYMSDEQQFEDHDFLQIDQPDLQMDIQLLQERLFQIKEQVKLKQSYLQSLLDQQDSLNESK